MAEKKGEIIIMDTDSRAATFVENIKGWVSRHGRFYGNDKMSERTARFDGSTHRKCEECENLVTKSYTLCPVCRTKKAIARYDALEKKKWDGEGMVYSDSCDEYFSDWDDIHDYAYENRLSLADMRLLICELVYLHEICSEAWEDELCEDADLPEGVEKALAEFNKVIRAAGPVSYRPGKFAVLLNGK